MDSPEYTNFGGLAERPDDVVHDPYVGVDGPMVPPPRVPANRPKQVLDLSVPSSWPEASWPGADQFKAADVVALKKWIIWMRTETKRQERLVNNYAPVKAAVLAGLPATVISLSISTWIAEFLAAKADGAGEVGDSPMSMGVGMGLLFLFVYAGVWVIHEIPSRGGIHWWRSWRENAERLTKLENRLRSYEMRLEELTGGGSTEGK